MRTKPVVKVYPHEEETWFEWHCEPCGGESGFIWSYLTDAFSSAVSHAKRCLDVHAAAVRPLAMMPTSMTNWMKDPAPQAITAGEIIDQARASGMSKKEVEDLKQVAQKLSNSSLQTYVGALKIMFKIWAEGNRYV